jgi:hypothetical protein
MTDVAATELIAESSEDREQRRDEVAAVSDLLRGRNEWSIEMRGRERRQRSKRSVGATCGRRPRHRKWTHTHKGEGLCNVPLFA